MLADVADPLTDPSSAEDAPPAAAARRGGRVALVGVLTGLLGLAVGLGIGAVTWRAGGGLPARPVIAVDGPEDPDRVAAVAAVALPSVVRVDRAGIDEEGLGNGSGVVVTDDGHVVTNLHVVAGATRIDVVWADGRRETAAVVGQDVENDLALLATSRTDAPPIDFADVDALQVGQLAVAVGSPFGLDGTVTAGIISALERPIDLVAVDGTRVRLPSVLQTDAEINPGNSGGPLVDSQGHMIGLTSAVLTSGTPSGSGVGFAIPADVVRRSVDALLADGEVQRARLGITGRSLTSADEAATGRTAGVLVESVASPSAAAAAGIGEGDVLVALDGEPLRTIDDLVREVRAAGVGATIVLTRVVDGAEEAVEVTLRAEVD